MKHVAIIGGHTELAKSLVSVIEERELALEVRCYSTTEHLGPTDHLLGPETMSFAEILVLTVDDDLSVGIAKGARKVGKVVIDLVGATRDEADARYVWPMLDGSAVPTPTNENYSIIATGLAGPLVSVLRALSSRGIQRLDVATYESAAIYGRPGMDELLDQCRAVCALQDPETKVLPDQLAFSTVPLAAETADEILEKEIRAGLEGLDIAPTMTISRILVPTFSADAAVLHVELEHETSVEQITKSIKAARGLQVPLEAASSGAALEREDALVSRIKVDKNRVKLWVCSDRLRRGSATPTAVLLERWSQ